MFTGIISHIGKVKEINDATFTFESEKSFCKQIEQGTSGAVNGVCLTVENKTQTAFSITIMPETQKKTMLQQLKTDYEVNLELPVTPQTFLSGHIIQGHVDGIGKIIDIKEDENSKIITIDIPQKLNKYIVEKGSITLNGISLTVIEVKSNYLSVGIIPYTWQHTMLHTSRTGDLINIETDVLAKYLENLTRKEEENEIIKKNKDCNCQ